MPPEEDVSAEPASPAPDPDPELELELELGVVLVVEPEIELEPEVDESPAHDELVAESELTAGVVDGGVVDVLGSELVVSVVEPVVVVVVGVSLLCIGVVVVDGVEVAGAVLSELVAGQPVVPLAPVVVVAGIVEPASTVGSVWVWVRPAGGFGVVLVFGPAFVVATPPCLVGVLAVDLCVVDEALSAAGLCGWVTTAAWCWMRAW